MQRISWNLRQDGVRFPSRRKIKADSDLPSGDGVLPGKYKIVASYANVVDSVHVEVMMDPRVEVTAKQKAEVKQAVATYEELVSKANEKFGKIQEARKTLKIIDVLISTIQDTTQKEWKEISKEHHKSLDSLEALFMDKEGLKGIQRNPNNLNAYLRTARRYIGSSIGKPGDNAMIALNKAVSKTQEVVDEIDQYMSSDWIDLKEKVESFEFSIFED